MLVENNLPLKDMSFKERNRNRRKLTQKKLKEVLYYNPKTGEFLWRKGRPGRGCLKGSKAGLIRKNRLIIFLYYKEYPATHLAWLYVYGYLPENFIDHIDRNTLNDKIDNLREVSVVCNARNTGNRCDNSSGVKGVHKVTQTDKWFVQIALHNKRKYLGTFTNFDEAVCHRLAAEQCLDWSGCDDNSPAYLYVQELLKIKKEETACSYL